MNNPKVARILTGTVVLAFGVVALLDALNIIPLWENAGRWWPVLLILAGILVFIGNTRQYITSLALIVLGTLFQLDALSIIDVNVAELFWPVIVIAIGLSILINRSFNSRNLKIQDIDNISVLFGGSDTVNKSKDYRGGKASAIFGGVSIDLRDATIKKEAVLEVFTLCGGVELKVPREWRVQSQVFPILGGVENKASNEQGDEDKPVLIITGTVALGGVEIHS